MDHSAHMTFSSVEVKIGYKNEVYILINGEAKHFPFMTAEEQELWIVSCTSLL